MALIHLSLGEVDRVFELLEEAIQIRDGWLHYIGVDPVWDPLRGDPRFEAVLRRIGL